MTPLLHLNSIAYGALGVGFLLRFSAPEGEPSRPTQSIGADRITFPLAAPRCLGPSACIPGPKERSFRSVGIFCSTSMTGNPPALWRSGSPSALDEMSATQFADEAHAILCQYRMLIWDHVSFGFESQRRRLLLLPSL